MNGPSHKPVRTPITFEMLRGVAEAASGTRDAPTWYVRDTHTDDPKKRGIIQVFTQEPQEGVDYHPGSLVIEVAQDPGIMPPPPPTQPSFGRLGFSVKNSLDLMDVLRRIYPDRPDKVAADSVFWTESAVEKFVVPYYASVSGPDAVNAIGRVLKVLHRRSPNPPPAGWEGPQPGEAFALVHIPTSEYFQADLAGTEFLAVVVGEEKRPVAVSLDELEAMRAALGWPE